MALLYQNMACEQQTHFRSSLLSLRRPEMRLLFRGYQNEALQYSPIAEEKRKLLLVAISSKSSFLDKNMYVANYFYAIFLSIVHFAARF